MKARHHTSAIRGATTDIELLLVPFDTGRRGWRMGAGPEHLLASGLITHLERCGHSVEASTLLPAGGGEPAFQIIEAIASAAAHGRR